MSHTQHTQHTQHAVKQWYRLEIYASGRRVNPTFNPSVYLTEDELSKFAWGICVGMRFKYKVPSVKVYDSENKLIKTCY